MTDGCASVVKQIVIFVLIINGIVEIQHQSPANSNHFFFSANANNFFPRTRIAFRSHWEFESAGSYIPVNARSESKQQAVQWVWAQKISTNNNKSQSTFNFPCLVFFWFTFLSIHQYYLARNSAFSMIIEISWEESKQDVLARYKIKGNASQSAMTIFAHFNDSHI